MSIRALLLCIFVIVSAVANVEGRKRPKVKKSPAPAPVPTQVEYNTDYPSACTVNVTSAEILCSGTLIDEKFILTAAHCVDDASASDLIIFCDGSDVEIDATDIVIPEAWISVATLPYDIAMIELEKKLQLPVVPLMRNASKIPEGELFTLETDHEELMEQIKTDAEYVSQEVCNSTLWWTRSLDYSQLCALTPSSCVSDTGSALFFTSPDTEAPLLVGIASFDTDFCERLEFPLVYTSIPSFAGWIDAVIAGNITSTTSSASPTSQSQLITNVTKTYNSETNTTVIVEAAKRAIAVDDSLTLSVLLDLGLSPDAEVDGYGRRLLHFAAESDAHASAEVLVSYGAKIGIVEDISAATPLHFAAANGSLPVAKILLEAGAIVNSVDDEHFTPLFYVLLTGTGKLTMLKFLLQSGANPHETDNGGLTPLHYAAAANWISATRLLIKDGANLIVFAKDGASPLGLAAATGANDTSVILIESGARADAKPRVALRETALSYAVRNLAPIITVKVLVNVGDANVNAQDRTKHTPLHRAAQNNDVVVIQFLLSKGADPTAKNKSGKTPVDLFCKKFNCKKSKYVATKDILTP